jgi:hypothetical protein
MADYKDIVGTAVRNNAGNLSDDQKDQIFYDSTNIEPLLNNGMVDLGLKYQI